MNPVRSSLTEVRRTRAKSASETSNGVNFREAVYKVVRKIPKGQVLTYGEVARRIGKPKAARAVGNILKGNFDPKIPCHRVIHSDGRIGDYNRGGHHSKLKILKKEGFQI